MTDSHPTTDSHTPASQPTSPANTAADVPGTSAFAQQQSSVDTSQASVDTSHAHVDTSTAQAAQAAAAQASEPTIVDDDEVLIVDDDPVAPAAAAAPAAPAAPTEPPPPAPVVADLGALTALTDKGDLATDLTRVATGVKTRASAGPNAKKKGNPLLRTVTPIIYTIGGLLLIPAIWAVLTLADAIGPATYANPDPEDVRSAHLKGMFMLVCWPVAILLLAIAVYYTIQLMTDDEGKALPSTVKRKKKTVLKAPPAKAAAETPKA